jgi:hypothetical protein
MIARPYRWIGPLCGAGVVINLCAGIHDFVYPQAWWSYLFGALSFACAVVCGWAWAQHRRLNRGDPP